MRGFELTSTAKRVGDHQRISNELCIAHTQFSEEAANVGSTLLIDTQGTTTSEFDPTRINQVVV